MKYRREKTNPRKIELKQKPSMTSRFKLQTIKFDKEDLNQEIKKYNHTRNLDNQEKMFRTSTDLNTMKNRLDDFRKSESVRDLPK